MRIKFFLKATAKRCDKTSTATIYVRLTIGHKVDTSSALPLSVNPNFWDAKGQRVKSRTVCDEGLRDGINDRLAELSLYLQREFAKKELLDYKRWLKDSVHTFFGIKENTRENKKSKVDLAKGDSFFETFDKFVDSRIMGKTRRQHYICLRERLQRFQAYKMLVEKDMLFRYSIHTFSVELFMEFSEFVSHEYDYIKVYPKVFEMVPYSKYYKPRPMGANSLSHVKYNLRIFLKWCYVQELTTNHSYMRMEIDSPIYGTPYYLTIEERDRLFDFVFPEGPFRAKYEMERDTFVFQCLVGCRISDLRSFTRDNIIGDYLEYIPKKTIKKSVRTVRVPLVDKARAILDRHKDESHPGGALFHFYQFSIYEEDLKKIFETVGITRYVTVYNSLTGKEERRRLCDLAATHLARRTFVGNLYKKIKDPDIIGSMSGHANGSRSFIRYRSIDDDIKNEAIRYIK